MILRYFELVTDEHPDTIAQYDKEMKEGRNPRDIKLILARVITKLYHEETGLKKAENYYETVFKEGEIPSNLQEIKIPEDKDSLIEIAPLLVEQKLVPSSSEFRRLIKQGGVKLNREKVLDIDCVLIEKENVLQIGKKKFVRLVMNR